MKWCGKRKSSSIPPIEEQQAEILEQLGDKLRQKRLEQTLSIEDVAAQTLIRQHLLIAIEKGLLAELPEPVYVQRFLKQYAEALGLDGDQLASSFPTGKRDRTSKGVTPAWQLIIPVIQLRPIHLYVFYIIAIALAVSTLSRSLNRNEWQTNKPLPELPIVADTTTLKPTQNQEVATVSATPKINNQIQIGVTLKAPSWIRVVADGKIAFQGLLPSGTQRTWVAKDNLTVLAGNAGGVLLTINQKESKQMGNLGEVQELTFAAPRL